MKVINKSARIICFGEHTLIPMEEVEIPAEAGNHPRMKELIDKKEIEVVEEVENAKPAKSSKSSKNTEGEN